MIKQFIKMISSTLLHPSVQEVQGMQTTLLEANHDYAQGQYFEHLAYQHHQDFLLHHAENPTDLSQADYRNAMWNFLRAALRGHKEAQYKLGIGYLHGELGLDKNFSHAEFWLKKATDQGHRTAKHELLQTYEKIAFS